MTSEPLLDLNQLRVFLLLAKHQNFRETARLLNISPSSVTQSIQALESKIGTALIDRTTRPIKLTQSGRLLANEGAQLLSQTQSLQKALESNDPFYVNLRLGYSESVRDTIAPWLSANLIQRVQSLSVLSSMTKPLLENFEHDLIDIVLSVSMNQANENTRHIPLWKENFLLVTPKNTSPILTLRDLEALSKHLPFLHYTTESWDRLQVMRCFRSLGLETPKKMGIESSYSIVGMVAQGLGWSLMPPLNIFMGRHFSSMVKIEKLNFIDTARTTMAITQDPKFDFLLNYIALESQTIMKSYVFSLLHQVNPILTENIKIISPTTNTL